METTTTDTVITAGPSPEKLAAREARLTEFRAMAKRLVEHAAYLDKNETARSTLRLLRDIDTEAEDDTADPWFSQSCSRFDRLTLFVLADVQDQWERHHKKDGGGEVTPAARVECARNTLIDLDLIRDLANLTIREGIAYEKRQSEQLANPDEDES